MGFSVKYSNHLGYHHFWKPPCIIIEGSLEVKLPTIWADGKAEVGRVREEMPRSEKSREEEEWEERRCKCAKRQEGRGSLCFCQRFVALSGRKVGSLKGRKTVKHSVFPMFCDPGGSQSRLAKAAGVEPFEQMRDQKLHAAVARSTSQSKCWKHELFGPLLDVETLKKGMPLFRRCRAKRISKWNMLKTDGLVPPLGVEICHSTTLHNTTLQLQRQRQLPL